MFNRFWNEVRLAWRVRMGRDGQQLIRLKSNLTRVLNDSSLKPIADAHRAIVDDIQAQTTAANRNNVTRTEAYLTFYEAHPEVHWAFLAHMVSRNGGWSMTDVKGEWFTRIAETVDGNRFFSFLERTNWLIFGDAYPQLLIYGMGRDRGENLSYLLPHFGVSRFMQVVWNDFWTHEDSSFITRAMIVNEQSFIEARVIQNWGYLKDVILTVEFQAQNLLGLNQVVLPYAGVTDVVGAHSATVTTVADGKRVKLAGTMVREFGSLADRIQVGKRLYSILFRDPDLHQKILAWARGVRHTASRSDMWPHVFTPLAEGQMDGPYEPHFIVGVPKPRQKIYSPSLHDAWADVAHEPVEPGDWCSDLNCMIYFLDADVNEPADFTDTYVESARTIERVILAKEKARALVKALT